MVRLVKPSWVAHSGYPIFSCDLHRDGLRFVTGGGDNKIKIWNLNVVKSEEEEQNKDSPKLLAICEHWGPVNCVRFSPNGQRLASCSDDRVVIVWELASKGPTKVFGSDEIIHEVWKPIAQLRGHIADVADLCWSPDGTKVASASLDNTIWIWDVVKKTSIVCLKGHTGWVKGVAWDPIGRYLASQSDDKSVIIWRTTDWSIEKRITEPYAKISSTSFFTRISFSPEGGCLATCQGVNKGNPTSVILKRSDWSVQCDFVGHKQPVVCNRWNPCAFVRPDPNHANNNNNKPFYICAIGSQDAGVSCWTNINQKAVLVVKDIFDQTVLDVSWSRDGYTLMGCGQDGSVIFMFFQPQDLGNTLSDREHQDLIQQIYGDILLLSSTSHGIAETPLQLSLEEQAKQNPIQENSLPSQTKPTSQTVNILTPRRSAQPGRPGAPVRSLAQAQAQGLAQPPPRATPVPVIPTPQPKPLSEVMAPPPPIPERKKPEPVAPAPAVAPTAAPSPAPAPFQANDTPAPIAPPSPPHDSTTNGKPEKRKSEAGGSASDVDAAPPKKPKVKKIKEKESEREREREREKKEKKKEKESADNNTNMGSPSKPTRSSAHPTLKLVAPAAGPKLTCTLSVSPSVVGLPKEQQNLQDTSNALSVEASIQDPEAINPVTMVTCHSGTQVLWEFTLRFRVTNITGNTQYFIALATQEGNLFIYSPNGVLMFPAIIAGDQIAYLESSNTQYLMAITCSGDLLMWDILSLQAVIPHGKCNVFTIISREQSIRRVKLCEPSGLPVITINTGESFMYHINMSCWMKISDEMFQTSEFKSPINNLLATTFGHRTGKGVLAEIQSMSSPSGRPLMASFTANSDSRTNDTISHLEHQLASSLILQSPNEYKHWLLTYARKLTSEAAESKLHELCTQLLGPSAGKGASKGKKWDPFVLGMTKRELLNEILPIIGSNRALQRLVTQFREQLDSLL